MKTYNEMATTLRQNGYFLGVRDLKINPEFSGEFMVSDPMDAEGGYAIVGDDLAELVAEAYDHLIDDEEATLPTCNGSGEGRYDGVEEV